MTSTSRWTTVFLMTCVLALVGPRVRDAAAVVDMTGRWFVVADFQGVPPSTWEFVQTGTTITLAGFGPGGSPAGGIIDPGTGVFDFDLGPFGFCAVHNSLSGTAAQDNKTFDASEALTLPPRCQPFSVTFHGSRCGNGQLDPGEQCDDGNASSGDCCSANCQFESASSPCASDGNACTDDGCDGAGTCQHTDNAAPCTANGGCRLGTCAAGSCVPAGPAPVGTPCDVDANKCTRDTCDAAGTCTSGGGGAPLDCGPCGFCYPQYGCVGPFISNNRPVAGGGLKIRDVTPDTKDTLTWTLETTGLASEFGDPLTATSYDLCLYVPGGGPLPYDLLARATAPAGGTCHHGRGCWKQVGTGFVYRDTDRTPSGVDSLKVKVINGKAKLLVKGKGPNLGLPGSLPVNMAPLTILYATSGNTFSIWPATFPNPTVSTATAFQGTAAPF